jgi:hypothetical protein
LQQNAVKPLKTGIYLQQKMTGYSKYSFSGINVKKAVAIKFRKFSRQISVSHTEALEAMLHFFERNDLAPDDDLGIHNNRTNKRINAVIAILKNIEKHQTKPTAEILQSLLHETANIEKEEDFDFGTPKLITENEELAYYRDAYFKKQSDLNTLKNEVKDIITNLKHVKSNFGPSYFRLDISKEKLETLKQKVDHVHHHHTPKTGQ